MFIYKLVSAPIEKEVFLNQIAVSSELEAVGRSSERGRGGQRRLLCSPCSRRPHCPQQQAEGARPAQTQEEKLAAALRAEVHDASCQVQSLQAETESLRALVSGPGGDLAFLGTILTLNH